MGQELSAPAPYAWDALESTQPPVRLRMVSEQEMVAMEVKWCDASTEKNCWSSDEDCFCTPWEAEKILPSSATNIIVRFKVVSAEGDKVDVPRVERYTGWTPRKPGGFDGTFKELPPETVEIRVNQSKIIDSERGLENSVDAVFTLTGYGEDCRLKSVWNAAGEPRSWEIGDDGDERPQPSEPLPVLTAADHVPQPPPELGNTASAAVRATNRFVAALKSLQEVRRDAIEELGEIDAGFDLQWWLINIGNTSSLTCDTISAITVIPNPILSIATGFSSACITTTCWTYDTIGEGLKTRRLRKILFWLMWNAVAVQELEKAWQRASEAAKGDAQATRAIETGTIGCSSEVLRTIVGNTYCITFDIVSSSASCWNSCPIKVPLYLTWIGVVGCFAVAANGWLSTKQTQLTLQGMAAELQRVSEMADEYIEKIPKIGGDVK